MEYYTFNMFVKVDGAPLFMDVVAIDHNAALADIQESYSGVVDLIQWGHK